MKIEEPPKKTDTRGLIILPQAKDLQARLEMFVVAVGVRYWGQGCSVEERRCPSNSLLE